jgi:hypothetical protein
MLRFYVGTVAFKWDDIPAKHCEKLRRDCLEDLHRIMTRWKNTAISYKLSVMCLLVIESLNAAAMVVSRLNNREMRSMDDLQNQVSSSRCTFY